VEDSEGDGSLADSTGTNESDRSGVFRETDDFLNPLIPSKEDVRWRWWGFSGYARRKYQVLDPSLVEIADLVRV
jgi:hypothetical protein